MFRTRLGGKTVSLQYRLYLAKAVSRVAIPETGTNVSARARLAPQNARAKAQQGSGWYAVLARTGLVAKGFSYGIVGFLAAKLALGDGGKATSRQGALQTIAQQSYGKILLILLACGFAAYALWRFVQAFAERELANGKKWAKRAGYIGRGLIYAGLTFSTVKILLGSGSQSQNEKAHKTTALVLSWPAGTWIVGAVGAAIIGAASGTSTAASAGTSRRDGAQVG
jgi:Domain of Unknown Function (DUF1206)